MRSRGGAGGCSPSARGAGPRPAAASQAARPVYTRVMSTSQDRIARTPGVCGGKACIAGHRVRVLDIVVWHEHQGMTPDEIVSHVPTIPLADVHAALAYYFDHVAFRTHSGSSGSPLFGIPLVMDQRWIHENPPGPT